MLCVHFSKPVYASETVGRVLVEDIEMYTLKAVRAFAEVHTDISTPSTFSTVNTLRCRITATVCIHTLIAGALFACDARQLATFPM